MAHPVSSLSDAHPDLAHDALQAVVRYQNRRRDGIAVSDNVVNGLKVERPFAPIQGRAA